MNREEKFVITISRQFGTGGHEIGAEIARRLGVKLLDKQILNEVAKRNRIVEEAMEKIETRNPLWRDDFSVEERQEERRRKGWFHPTGQRRSLQAPHCDRGTSPDA